MYETSEIERLTASLKTIMGNWELSPSTAISLITVSENATFLAHDPKNDRKVVFRVHAINYHELVDIKSELCWIDALIEDNIINTPPPIEMNSGGYITTINDGSVNRYVAAFEFMDGKEPKVGKNLTKWFRTLGETTAKLHLHSKNWERPDWFSRKVWDVSNCIGPNGFWGNWRNARHLDDEGELIIADAVSIIQKRITKYGSSAETFGLVHADLRLANLLVDKELGVIDFDDAGFCWFGYDFAAAISFHELEPSIPELQEAWIKGYRTIATFSDKDIEELPTFIMMRRIMLTSWIATHSHSNESGELGSAYTDGTVALAKEYLLRNSKEV
jgi:Ser/Thr protein kinase RdoA (MazF antagonist)